jgi:nucleotide-binding universal stress UspA family protein
VVPSKTREDSKLMFTKIAVAYDGSPEADRALTAAISLAKIMGVGIHTITMLEAPPAYTAFAAATDGSVLRTLEEDRDAYYEHLQRLAVSKSDAEGVQVITHLEDGDTVDSIHHFVRDHQIDLLVIGLHRRSLRMSSLWSVSYALAQELSCNMLGVH